MLGMLEQPSLSKTARGSLAFAYPLLLWFIGGLPSQL
jgi:hypothetical protein